MTAAFQFIHAADLQLDRPFTGLSVLPDPLRDVLSGASLLAVERIVEAAIARSVEFVVLTGDGVHPERVGPRPVARLLEQLERLVEAAIPVYWAASSAEARLWWTNGLPLPPGVHLFADEVQRRTHMCGEGPGATLVGVSGWPNQILQSAAKQNLATLQIAVAHGPIDPAIVVGGGIQYWALGGRPRRDSVDVPPVTVHYPGTPQGRSPDETGPHGCTLVTVGEHGQLVTELIETDVVRWQTERVEWEGERTLEGAQQLLGERMLQLMDAAGGRTLLVCWRLDGAVVDGGPTAAVSLADKLLHWLQQEFAEAALNVWPVSVQLCKSPQLPRRWYEEETLLGDFLRTARYYQQHPDEPLDLQPYMPGELADSLGQAAGLDDPDKRQQVLAEAIQVGARLLSAGSP